MPRRAPAAFADDARSDGPPRGRSRGPRGARALRRARPSPTTASTPPAEGAAWGRRPGWVPAGGSARAQTVASASPRPRRPRGARRARCSRVAGQPASYRSARHGGAAHGRARLRSLVRASPSTGAWPAGPCDTFSMARAPWQRGRHVRGGVVAGPRRPGGGGVVRVAPLSPSRRLRRAGRVRRFRCPGARRGSGRAAGAGHVKPCGEEQSCRTEPLSAKTPARISACRYLPGRFCGRRGVAQRPPERSLPTPLSSRSAGVKSAEWVRTVLRAARAGVRRAR
ncbi:hypothetical protein GA0115252_16248 [Streptomyces sp. DfronAA-171]|nr:hypothetical protein GA0115252_16248 [Streptomyces sp. DfronAA-171]